MGGEMQIEDKKNNDEAIEDNDGSILLENKKIELTELENDLRYLMNLLSIALDERNKMNNSGNYSEKDLLKINNDIEYLNRKIEDNKTEINSKNLDINSIIILRNNLNNAREKEIITNEKLSLDNLKSNFKSLYSELELELNNIIVLLEGNNDLI